MTIDDVLEQVLRREGGYVNDARDSGGETNWGITAAVARQQGYTGPMRSMPRATALEIYRRLYVVRPGFDQSAALSMPLAAELVDTGVNMGPGVAAQFLQRALNLLNNRGTLWPDLLVDGQAGAATRAALGTYLRQRGPEGERRLLALLNAFQGARYAEIAERREKDEAFFYGWLERITA